MAKVRLNADQSGVKLGLEKKTPATTSEADKIQETLEMKGLGQAPEGSVFGGTGSRKRPLTKAERDTYDKLSQQLSKKNKELAALGAKLVDVERCFQVSPPIEFVSMKDKKTGNLTRKANPYFKVQKEYEQVGAEMLKLAESIEALISLPAVEVHKKVQELFAKGKPSAVENARAQEFQEVWKDKFAHEKLVELDDAFETMNFLMGSNPILEPVDEGEILTIQPNTIVHTPFGMFTLEKEIEIPGVGVTLANVLTKDEALKANSADVKVKRYIVHENNGMNEIAYVVEEILGRI